MHAGQGLALGNVCLTEVTLVTRGHEQLKEVRLLEQRPPC